MMKLAKMGLPLHYDLGKNVYTAEDIQIGVIGTKRKKCKKIKKMDYQPTAINLKGKLLDDMGEPIPSAHIFNKTRNNGTVSDTNGVFGLYAEPDDDIQISYVGFKTINTKARNLGKTIALELDVQVLPEVIVKPKKEQLKCPLLCWIREHKDMVMIGLGVLSVGVAIYAVSKQKSKKDVR